jgi:3-hydroxyisobutyrate dehydrogenase-like beta-hydroxyacid dehydrogenase
VAENFVREFRGMRIGFVGAGLMGAPMVRNLVKAGHDVVVSTRTPSRLAGEGWTVVGSPAEAAGDAEVFCSIVPDSPEVRAVVESALTTLPRGAVVIDVDDRAGDGAFTGAAVRGGGS